MYDAAIGRWGVVDPLADQRTWISPYNFVQNKPLIRVDPDGMLDDYYNKSGAFLYRDTKETDEIKIIDQGDFDAIASKYGSDVMNDRSSSNLGLLGDLESKSVGINQAELSDGAASNVFTDILSKMEGIDMDKLFNGKVSIDNRTTKFGIAQGVNHPERGNGGPANTVVKGVTIRFMGDASFGTIKVTVNFAYKRNSLATTVSNVQNMLGVHKYQGHGIHRFAIGGGPNYKAYELQMRENAPGWRTSTEYYKNYIRSNYNTAKKSER